MGETKLKLSDAKLQQKLETIMQQFGWDITRRVKNEDDDLPPQISYRLKNGDNHEQMLEHIYRIGYGKADEPTLTIKGKRRVLMLTVRQLAPTNTARQGGLATFGDGGDE